MEELRSTEILDKEIQEDARRKADRILKDADDECAKMMADVEDRIQSGRDARKASYDEKLAAKRRDSEAAIPLEKQRFLISYEDSAVHDACMAYLAGLKPAQKLELIEKLLEQKKDILKDRRFNAQVCGFDISAVKKLLEKELGAKAILSCIQADDSCIKDAGGSFEGCMLESDDRAVKCRLTISEIIDGIADTKREELVNALFAGRLPE